MRRVFEVLAVGGFVVSCALHAMVVAGAGLPAHALLATFIAVFPVFIVAVLSHPARRSHLGGAHVFWEDVTNVPVWLRAAVIAAGAYLLVLFIVAGGHKISVLAALTFTQRLAATWAPALFYAGAYMLLVSGRRP